MKPKNYEHKNKPENAVRKTQLQKTTHYVLLLCLICFGVHSQNLVPNPGFESYNACPTSNSFPAANWFNPNTATPDYFTPCGTGSNAPPNVLFGPQTAHSGNSFAGAGWYGLGGGFYDYMQVQLTTSLTASTVYSVSMWVSLANGAKWASDDVGIHISNGTFKSASSMTVATNYTLATTPTGFGVFNTLTPQIKCADNNFITDTMGWTLVSGTYTATGGENAITLGCFENWVSTGTLTANPSGNARCYYFFDDVSIEAIAAPAQPSAIAGSSNVCPLSSYVYSVAPVSGASSYTWNLPSGWTGSSVTNTISVITSTTSGTVAVAAVGQGGTSPFQNVAVSVTNIQASITQTNSVLQTTVSGSYQWVDCSKSYSVVSVGSNTFAPTQSGSYALIISRNDCVDTSACLNVTIVPNAVSEIANGLEYAVFPNPASDKVFINLGAAGANPLIQMSDYTGHVVYQEYAFPSMNNDSVSEVSLGSLSSGVYFIQLIYPEKRSAIKKIVVIK